MSNKFKLNKPKSSLLPSSSWVDNDGIHMYVPIDMSTDQIDVLTAKYQENIRKSAIWPQLVKQYGKQEAENLLKQFRVEVRE